MKQKFEIEFDEQAERDQQRKARRKARIEHDGGNAPTGTKPHKNKKHYKRKPKHGGSLKYAI